MLLISYDHVLVYSSSLLHMVLKHLVWWTRLWSGSGHQLPSCLGSCSFCSGSRTSYGKERRNLRLDFSGHISTGTKKSLFFWSETLTPILYFCSNANFMRLVIWIIHQYTFLNLDFHFISFFKSNQTPTNQNCVLLSLHITTRNEYTDPQNCLACMWCQVSLDILWTCQT